jgi:pimeloyl-ACP methyl ester carboxylesterase
MSRARPAAPPDSGRPAALTFLRGALRILSATSPGIASRVAADLFLTPRRHPTPPRERELLAHGEPFTVRLGSATEIRAWRFGAGPAVILVHGWEGRGSQLTPFVAPLVERGFSAIAFDAPGHGASPGSRSSLPHFAWAVRAVADVTGDPHAIVAHSLGCAATTLALRDGLSVQRLAYLAPPLDPVDYTARFGDILGLDESVIRKMQTRIEERFARKWSDYSLADTARRMTAPLLVVHDRDDRDTYWSEGAALAEAWPGAELVTTEGLGHRRILRDAEIVERVASFVAERRRPGG